MHLILMCRSLTAAQRAAHALLNHGIFASVTKAPQSANPGGCTYGVKIAARNLAAAQAILEAAEIHVEKTVEASERTRYGAAT